MFGRCLCGSVRFEIDMPVLSCVTCHCESCRRQCSAPMTAYVGVADGSWRWTKGAPKTFNSSPGVDRPLTRLKDFDLFEGFEARFFF